MDNHSSQQDLVNANQNIPRYNTSWDDVELGDVPLRPSLDLEKVITQNKVCQEKRCSKRVGVFKRLLQRCCPCCLSAQN